ncbi:hypothetical protein BDR26DRAFT_864207 [Obelidium mucronatum]|nr:hypothetical protein BDR26DRAFT_864207 [Obelidium mucronatum]
MISPAFLLTLVASTALVVNTQSTQDCFADTNSMREAGENCQITTSSAMTAASKTCYCRSLDIFKKVVVSCTAAGEPGIAARATANIDYCTGTSTANVPALAPTCTNDLDKIAKAMSSCLSNSVVSSSMTVAQIQTAILKCQCTKQTLDDLSKLSTECAGNPATASYVTLIDRCKTAGFAQGNAGSAPAAGSAVATKAAGSTATTSSAFFAVPGAALTVAAAALLL